MSLFLTIGTPVLAFAGALLGVVLNRRAARELEARSRREEMMRTLRWAAELAAPGPETKKDLGLEQLRALGAARLSPDQQVFVDAALTAVHAGTKIDSRREETTRADH